MAIGRCAKAIMGSARKTVIISNLRIFEHFVILVYFRQIASFGTGMYLFSPGAFQAMNSDWPS